MSSSFVVCRDIWIGRCGGVLHNYFIDCFRIMSEECVLINGLKEIYSFELCIGENGRIYIACGTINNLLLAVNAIFVAENMDNAQIKKMLRKLRATNVNT